MYFSTFFFLSHLNETILNSVLSLTQAFLSPNSLWSSELCLDEFDGRFILDLLMCSLFLQLRVEGLWCGVSYLHLRHGKGDDVCLTGRKKPGAKCKVLHFG